MRETPAAAATRASIEIALPGYGSAGALLQLAARAIATHAARRGQRREPGGGHEGAA
jgi:hypothetical protein